MTTRILFPPRASNLEEADNDCTVIFVPEQPAALPRLATFEELFLDHYRSIRDAARQLGRAGVVLAAMRAEESAPRLLSLALKDETYNSAIVGRHGRCDLYLDADPSLSLRHLAVLISRERGRLRLRVLDLHTARGFLDESGRKLASLLADGPVFLRVASYALVLLPAVEPDTWPEDADAAWQQLPQRSHLDARAHELPSAPPAAARFPEPGDGTNVVALDGPVELESLGHSGESTHLGTLVLRSAEGQESIDVGPEAAARGILLGRYRRCDSEHLIALCNRRLSRVHLLIVGTADGLYAVDTASTNDTRLGKVRIRSTLLEAGTRLMLPGDVELEWRPGT